MEDIEFSEKIITRHGSRVYDTSISQIQNHYLRGWFALDVISMIPFSLIPGGGGLAILRLVRILRLLKLIRVLRASRIYQRFQARNSLPHSVEAMIKLLLMLIICSHWMACLWIMSATLQKDLSTAETPPYTWLDALAESYFCDADGCDEDEPSDHLSHNGRDKYFAAVYWSVTTITSVGYGDITPQNPGEMLICTFR